MLELFAAILTLWCVWLTAKRDLMSWPVGIAALVLYGCLFFQVKLYADLFLQLVFLFQSIYGWYNWQNNKDYDDRVVVSKMTKRNRAYSVIAIIFLYITMAHILIHHTDASVPYLDAFLASLCIVANFLLSKRKIENWYLWILADFLYVGLFVYKEMYVSAVLYFVLMLLAIKGFLSWKNKMLVNNDD